MSRCILYTQIPLWKNNMHVKSRHFLSIFLTWLLFVPWVMKGELITFYPITGHVFLQLLGTYLECDKDGSSHVCNRAHILLLLYQYVSCIVPLFLFWKFLYSYISDANRSLPLCHPATGFGLYDKRIINYSTLCSKICLNNPRLLF